MGGRAGLIVGATLRLLPQADRRDVLSATFSADEAALAAVRDALQEGARLVDAALEAPGRISLRVEGSRASLVRDRATWRRAVADRGGAPLETSWTAPPAGEECERAWEDLAAPAALFRLSLDSVIAVGGSPATVTPSPDALTDAFCRAADAQGILGGQR
jgi:FAD/FMN-containing dehydrogenase